MFKSKHDLIEVTRFGERLLDTGDLDPAYIALWGAKLPEDQLKRLLLAYFCFYHLGVAAFISEFEGADFFECLLQAAENKCPYMVDGVMRERWPRGVERRHFRGPDCLNAVNWLRLQEPRSPENLINRLIGNVCKNAPLRLQDILDRIQAWPLFGPWIAFKAADMLERVLDVPIYFPDDLAIMYKEPRAALDLFELSEQESNRQLLSWFERFPAPPSNNRPCGVQEVETCLCKWKSFLHSHYWIGKDIEEVQSHLVGWGNIARKLRNNMPVFHAQGLFGHRPTGNFSNTLYGEY